MSSVLFYEKEHKYVSEDPNEDIFWISATTLIDMFKQPFDAIKESEKQARKKDGKYYGLTPMEIRLLWQTENKRSTDTGSWYHDYKERQTLRPKTITRDGIELPILENTFKGKAKVAPDQKLGAGIYPEFFCYLKSAGVCGQSDRVEIYNQKLYIRDYKTNKKIEKEGFTYADGTRKKMSGPVCHLDDCEFNHYALQMSLYMYIILRHNYHLLPGDIIIDHVKFKVAGKDKYGFPVLELDAAGDPIIETIEKIELPYMEMEVQAIFRWLRENRYEIMMKKQKALKDDKAV